MIQFEESTSPHFEAHKSFVTSLQSDLPQFLFDGYCNAYGLDIKGHDKKTGTQLTVKKHQTTRNGVWVPLESLDRLEVQVQMPLNPEKAPALEQDLQNKKSEFAQRLQLQKLKVTGQKITLETFDNPHKPVVLYSELLVFAGY
jgi:hypothetical protein